MEQLPPPDSPDASFRQLHNPLRRLLPAPIRHRPAGVEGSLKAVETFFGADISSKMVDAATKLSEKQVTELESQLREANFGTHVALSIAERPKNLVAENFFKSIRQSPTERDFEKLLPSRGQDSVFWPQRHIVNTEEIGTHEDLLPIPHEQHSGLDVCSAPSLKHMALYCQQTVIRDPLYASYGMLHAYQKKFPGTGDEIHSHDAHRRRIANGIRQLLPIAALIRDGVFVLATDASPDKLFDRQIEKNDPFLWQLLGQHRPDLQQEMLRLYAVPSPHNEGNERAYNRALQRLWQLEPQVQQIVRESYPYEVSEQTWQRIIAFSNWAYTYSLTPFTSDPDIVRHLQHGARIAMDGPPDKGPLQMTRFDIAPAGMAVSYQVPSLQDIEFDNIARLRDSSLFDGVRTAMVELAEKCAESAPQDFDAYQHLVAESAQDIVGPLYRKLEHRLRWGKLARLGLAASSKALSMEFSGVAGRVAAAGVKRLGKAELRRQKQLNETAHGILRSLFDYR